MAKKDKTLLDDRFLRKVLFCVSGQYRTSEEIWKKYMRDFPPNFLLKNLNFPATIGEVGIALEKLCKGGCVEKDVTRYLDEVLPKDVSVYRLTDFGTSSLQLRKKQ